jgi:hypothetical protein
LRAGQPLERSETSHHQQYRGETRDQNRDQLLPHSADYLRRIKEAAQRMNALIGTRCNTPKSFAKRFRSAWSGPNLCFAVFWSLILPSSLSTWRSSSSNRFCPSSPTKRAIDYLCGDGEIDCANPAGF